MYSEFSGFSIDELAAMGFVGVFLVIFLAVMLVVLVLAIATYVLNSLSLYTIAKRRGIKNPWLAWIPYGNVWILGSISDQYQYVAKGKITNRRKLLLGLAIGVGAVSVLVQIVNAANSVVGNSVLAQNVNIANSVVSGAVNNESFAAICAIALILLSIPLFIVSIVNSVFCYVAYYDLFRSCKEKNATLFLVLSIVITYSIPVILMICRNKDEGMPALKAEVTETPEE